MKEKRRRRSPYPLHFKVKVFPPDEHTCHVHVYADRRTFLRHANALSGNKRDNAAAMVFDGGVASDGDKKCVAVALFHRAAFNELIIAHEAVHVAANWLKRVRRRKSIRFYFDADDPPYDEECLADVVGEVCSAITRGAENVLMENEKRIARG